MNMKDYILYNVLNQVLICCQHGYDISSKWITNHFQRQHKTIQLETRNKIIEYAKALQLWDSEGVLSNHDGSFMEELKVNTGYQCQYKGCSELHISKISMQKHCYKAHLWTRTKGIQWTKQSYQTIFQGPHVKFVSLNVATLQ